MKWVNFGGGHHITRPDYDREVLKKCIRHMQETYGVEVYLEPGEAVALNAGILLTEVLEIVDNGMKIAILDTSAACHMPDVLEMPYRPPLKDAGDPAEECSGEKTEAEAPSENTVGSGKDAGACNSEENVCLPSRRSNLSCGRRDRRLLLCQTAAVRGQAGVSGYGDLHYGEDEHV